MFSARLLVILGACSAGMGLVAYQASAALPAAAQQAPAAPAAKDGDTPKPAPAVKEQPTALSPDQRLMATADGNAIVISDVQTQKALLRMAGHRDTVTALAFAPDGKVLASGSLDKTICFWELATGRQLRRLTVPNGVDRVTFSPDAKTLTSRETDRTLRDWEIATGRQLKQTKDNDAPKPAKEPPAVGEKPAQGAATVTSPDQRRIALADDKTITIVDAQTQKTLMKMLGHTDKITALAFSPDGKLLASGSVDRTIALWDMGAGRQVRRFVVPNGVDRLSVSPDGTTLISRETDRTVREWELATGKELKQSKEK